MLQSFGGKQPKVHDSVFLAEGSMLIGDVEVGRDSSIWFHSVIRGDINSIRIGEMTNIQDLSVLHVTHSDPVIVGARVTVGHRAIIHGAVVEDCCLIGMGATLLDGCRIGACSLVAAGALVTPGKRVKAGEIWAGSPAKYMRDITEDEKAYALESVEVYCRLAREYAEEIAGPEKRQSKPFRSKGYLSRP